MRVRSIVSSAWTTGACGLYEQIVTLYPEDLEAKRNLASLYLEEPAVQNLPRARKLLQALESIDRFNVNYLKSRLTHKTGI
jgi:hypothetical protein